MSDLDKYLTAAHEAVELAIELTMRDSLRRATPQAGFLGEETGVSTDGLAWVLDPIDGTEQVMNRVASLSDVAASLPTATVENAERTIRGSLERSPWASDKAYQTRSPIPTARSVIASTAMMAICR
ncbi:inositol monophosphatase family protein [Nocardioides sp. NPDC006273]|uniref:inositol monophosphatase family protein n=1 Tax=Nocardioides sp. NPDC006273 TaxID=3155598 RepID=UPI0033B6D714